jgi:hypothetical protein
MRVAIPEHIEEIPGVTGRFSFGGRPQNDADWPTGAR